jgi:ATP-dependent Clp protease protease subunit
MLRTLIKELVRQIVSRITEGGEGAEGTEEGEGRKIVVLKSGAEAKGEIDMRVIGLFSTVNEENVAEIFSGLLYLNEMNVREKDEEKRKDINFYVSTYGGSADDMFALYDLMKEVQDTSDIVTIGMGKVMSAGVLILAAGTKGKRKIGRNCRVMIHSVIAGNHGSLPNLINEMEAIQDLQELYIERLVEETKMTKKQMKKLLEQKVNIYLSAEEAVKHGIADIIV